jgi:predicted RNA-binding Zn-ribbon protein involved in translation (DUF1610 family)
MNKAVPQYYTDLLCPNCGKPFVFIKGKLGQVQKPLLITQKQPYCRNCGFTAISIPETQNAACSIQPLTPCGRKPC